MRPRLLLFLTACFLGGVGGFAGSAVGGAFGKTALFTGGFVGGALVAALVGPLARWRKWIAPERARHTSVGASLGFIAAATIAVNTLSTPIGPVLSCALIGVGALVGAGGMSPRAQRGV